MTEQDIHNFIHENSMDKFVGVLFFLYKKEQKGQNRTEQDIHNFIHENSMDKFVGVLFFLICCFPGDGDDHVLHEKPSVILLDWMVLANSYDWINSFHNQGE